MIERVYSLYISYLSKLPKINYFLDLKSFNFHQIYQKVLKCLGFFQLALKSLKSILTW